MTAAYIDDTEVSKAKNPSACLILLQYTLSLSSEDSVV